MDMGLRGKLALVTGSTAGIGRAVADAFAAEGASVVVTGRDSARVADAVQAIVEAHPGAQVRGVAADLGTADGCRRVVEEVPAVDILVNNVGIFEPKPFVEISDDEWLRFFEVNVLSGVRLSRAYLPDMLRRNWGRILFISSESGLQIPVEMIHYGTTKTAQLAVARGLAETTRGTAVTVNAILPGPTLSQGVGDFVAGLAARQQISADEMQRQFFRSARPSSLLQRFETPEEIAAMVVFVASERASAVNGASLRVDGGVVRSIA